MSSPGSGSVDHSRYRRARPSLPSSPPWSVSGSKVSLTQSGQDDRGAAGTAMAGGGCQCGLHRRGVGAIHDRVVDQHQVELAPQVERTHVAEHVFAVRVERATHGQHVGRAVRQGQLELVLEVIRQASPAGAQFEQRVRRPVGGRSQCRKEVGRLLHVMARRRQQRPPSRQVAVHPQRLLAHASRTSAQRAWRLALASSASDGRT